jgi:secondary thiamine-phosphate synthase enzyme
MRQTSTVLTLVTPGRGFTDITGDVAQWLGETGIDEGLLTLLCRHTSASLLIQENADNAVQRDIANWLSRLASEDDDYEHSDEGADDMPAHLRTVLTGVNLTIPVQRGEMLLGRWQGIYLAEHRRRAHHREIALHVIGD